MDTSTTPTNTTKRTKRRRRRQPFHHRNTAQTTTSMSLTLTLTLTLTPLLLSSILSPTQSFLLPSPQAHTTPTKPVLPQQRQRLQQHQPHHRRIAPSQSSSSLSSSTPPPSSSSSSRERAGTEGYSILRQPLQWDPSVDPRFDAPLSLIEDDDSSVNRVEDEIWFEGRRKPKPKPNETGEDGGGVDAAEAAEAAAEELDLFQRTIDTLDYDVVLERLMEECASVPARGIIRDAVNLSTDDGQGEGEEDAADSDILTMGLTATNLNGVHARYGAVTEMKSILAGDVYVDPPPPEDEDEDERPLLHPKTKQPMRKKRRRTNQKIRLDGPPVSTCTFDLRDLLDKIDSGGVLDGPEILEVTTVLEACVAVGEWCTTLEHHERTRKQSQRDNPHPSESTPSFQHIPALGSSIYIPPTLLTLLQQTFDPTTGLLSPHTFPTIGTLRAQLRTLRSSVLSTLDTLLAQPSMRSNLSLESGGSLYSQIDGRIVVPVDGSVYSKNPEGMGIVHDSSRSGKTRYIEPREIVGPTNEMRRVEVELRREEAKVWRMLTREVEGARVEIERTLRGVGHVDLVVGRCRLGSVLGGVVPVVGGEEEEGEEGGVMRVDGAKHPVLLLRKDRMGGEVVGSDVRLGVGENRGLVLTGPNSGGKTVILKLIGLLALLARDGIPIPSSPTSPSPPRVDFFSPILADVGDIQSLSTDLSTFSGHMLVCREILRRSSPTALVLLDEVGSGTDPAQGVAIAQALLEAVVDAGARVALTTHYLPLKSLASVDDRFTVGGMEFVGGRPTYRLEYGVMGESYALSVAERLGLPEGVLRRAEDLLDEDTRRMGDLLREMEEQKGLVELEVEELRAQKVELEGLEEEVRKRTARLERERLTARRDEAKKFALMLEEKEKVLEGVLEKLKSDPTRRIVAKSWEEIKYVKRDAMREAEGVVGIGRVVKKGGVGSGEEGGGEIVPLSDMPDVPPLKKGDRLIVCRPGSLYGTETSIVNMSGKKISVSVRGMAMSMTFRELALPTSSSSPLSSDGKKANKRAQKRPDGLSNAAARALEEEGEYDMDGSGGWTTSTTNTNVKQSSSDAIMRTKSNTVDCIGCTFEEARRKCEDKFAGVMMEKSPVVYILHGHGKKGVLKKKIRDWLGRDRTWVKSHRSADQADGGDAFTMVRVKKIL